MSHVTVQQLYEQAKQLSPKDRRRLFRLLEEDSSTRQAVAPPSTPSFLETDPWFVELREAQARAEAVLELHSTEEVMSWIRRRPWVQES